MNGRRHLVDHLKQFSNLTALRQSTFFAEHRQEIEALLQYPEVHSCAAAVPLLHSFVRVVQWNIEKGKGYEAILEQLRSDDTLKWADILLINEADFGMNRSGNRHIARCLAEELRMNVAFGPAHIELTKGVGDELRLAGENRESLQGNAVLSRYPIAESTVVPLPDCFNHFEFHEKRYGRRCCIWTRLETPAGSLWAGSTHLEVRNTPRCRALQMDHIMKHLPASGDASCMLGGDLNTNGFARGTRCRTLGSFSQLVMRSATAMKERFRHPEWSREPLFRVARAHGFSWSEINSEEDTATAPIGELEDAGLLPDFLIKMLRKRLEPYQGQLCFKLDWLLARNVRGLHSGELQDRETGVSSRSPGCVPLPRDGPSRPSDHRPIYADICLPQPAR
jgi:endonuclease/exonuclease/phosphatase family metal-dependent hydrolase